MSKRTIQEGTRKYGVMSLWMHRWRVGTLAHFVVSLCTIILLTSWQPSTIISHICIFVPTNLYVSELCLNYPFIFQTTLLGGILHDIRLHRITVYLLVMSPSISIEWHSYMPGLFDNNFSVRTLMPGFSWAIKITWPKSMIGIYYVCYTTTGCSCTWEMIGWIYARHRWGIHE